MAPTAETRLAALGIELPEPPISVANYVATLRLSNMLFVPGQLCLDRGALVATGCVGTSVTLEDATAAARACAINILAQCRSSLGSLDRVRQVVRLGGFIASAPHFEDQATVMNGASDLMVEVFGDAGRHTRSTVGVSALPKGAAVEIEAVFEIEP
ncbi:RidA family protein [Ensifer sp. ENS09]|uniref:RidA family protein n=1 Tax=Ensifer sp. ENS09 TaxID=2769263 RepID=UPI00177F1B5A|nr:RidA family protein [Ensifer sp. ENS09]MBD9650100.1 RidA family protein [Ensifer sp. ENS09]